MSCNREPCKFGGCSCHLLAPCQCCLEHYGICWVCEKNEVDGLGACLSCGEEEQQEVVNVEA